MNTISLNDLQNENYTYYIQCFEKKGENVESLRYYCKIGNCNKSYKDPSGAIRHAQSKHSEYCNIIRNNNTTESQCKDNTILDVKVKVNLNVIWDACIDLVCKNGLPLCYVEYPAFKKIIEPYASALKSQGHSLAINRESLKNRINETASTLKDRIKAQVKGKLISVMTDIATRYNRSVLGISISYVHDDEHLVQTIGMKVLKYSHTATYIFQMILETLAEYEIGVDQIISGTTDNGTNMIKAISELDAYYQEMPKNENENGDGLIENDEFIDDTIFDAQYYDNLLTEVRSMFPNKIHTDLIHGISCAAHCLHLVITHAINDTPAIKSLLEKARDLAKKLRTPTLRTMIQDSGLNLAIIDVVTRWNSIYNMVGTILHLHVHIYIYLYQYV